MKFSSFGQSFNRKTGIINLMEDFGEAYNSHKPVYMLGGGNPAQIPQMQARFREQMSAILGCTNKFDTMVGCYDTPQGDGKFIKSLAALLKKTFSWPINESNIVLTNGSQSSFFSIFNAFAGQYPDGSFKQILLPLAPEYIGYTGIAQQRGLFSQS